MESRDPIALFSVHKRSQHQDWSLQMSILNFCIMNAPLSIIKLVIQLPKCISFGCFVFHTKKVHFRVTLGVDGVNCNKRNFFVSFASCKEKSPFLLHCCYFFQQRIPSYCFFTCHLTYYSLTQLLLAITNHWVGPTNARLKVRHNLALNL